MLLIRMRMAGESYRERLFFLALKRSLGRDGLLKVAVREIETVNLRDQ